MKGTVRQINVWVNFDARHLQTHRLEQQTGGRGCRRAARLVHMSIKAAVGCICIPIMPFPIPLITPTGIISRWNKRSATRASQPTSGNKNVLHLADRMPDVSREVSRYHSSRTRWVKNSNNGYRSRFSRPRRGSGCAPLLSHHSPTTAVVAFPPRSSLPQCKLLIMHHIRRESTSK